MNRIIERKKRSKLTTNIKIFYKELPDVSIKKKKIKSDKNSKIYIPLVNEYQKLIETAYLVKDLKVIAKHYNQKLSGNKKDLLYNLYNHLKLSYFSIKLQKMYRGIIIRKVNEMRGPAYFNRTLCNNPSDFYTLETMKEIEQNQFISFKDTDGFIYGFDILSLYTHIKKNKKTATNPYNRNSFSKEVISNLHRIIHLSKIFNKPTNVVIPNENINHAKQIELRALSIFQEIDALGNYTDSNWLLALNPHQICAFIRELYDIWNYRAQMDQLTKMSICPPLGNPFSELNINYFSNINLTFNELKTTALSVVEKFIKNGVNREYKVLGAYYVLTALTIVSSSAASALPWLYDSVVYEN